MSSALRNCVFAACKSRWFSLHSARQIERIAAPGQVLVHSARGYSSAAAAEPLVQPPPEGAEKQYPEKIKRIVDEISKLTLIEVADLNDLLKKTLNIQEVAPMSFAMPMQAAAPGAPAEEEEEAPKAVKTSFTVKLTKFDETKKVALIKEIKNVMEGMNLVQAKKFVEAAPQVVRGDIGKDEAEKLKAALEAVGGVCEIE